MKKTGYTTISLIVLFVPLLVLFWPECGMAEEHVQINEIAWMGTTDSHTNEWIELKNTSENMVDISGWKLEWGDTIITFSSEGEGVKDGGFYNAAISPGEYLLMERTDDEPVLPTADIIYKGSLSNEGETLILKDTNDTVIDEVVGGDLWEAIGGEKETYYTPQRTSTGWITASPTPKAINKEPESDKGMLDEVNGLDKDTENNDTRQTSEDAPGTTVERKDYEKNEITTYSMDVMFDPVVVAGVPMGFQVEVMRNGVRQIRGLHSWNFGDGILVQDYDKTTAGELKGEHMYHYPGLYRAVFSYKTSHLKPESDILHTEHITVIEPDLSIAQNVSNATITVHNNTHRVLSLEKWQIAAEGEVFTIPKYTHINPNAFIQFAEETTGLSTTGTASLLLPSGEVVDQAVPLNATENQENSTEQPLEDVELTMHTDTKDNSVSTTSPPQQNAHQQVTITPLPTEKIHYRDTRERDSTESVVFMGKLESTDIKEVHKKESRTTTSTFFFTSWWFWLLLCVMAAGVITGSVVLVVTTKPSKKGEHDEYTVTMIRDDD